MPTTGRPCRSVDGGQTLHQRVPPATLPDVVDARGKVAHGNGAVAIRVEKAVLLVGGGVRAAGRRNDRRLVRAGERRRQECGLVEPAGGAQSLAGVWGEIALDER